VKQKRRPNSRVSRGRTGFWTVRTEMG
jgi:hypothetical protein